MSSPTWQLLTGDCLKVLRNLGDNSIDAVVTDPPYGLSKEPDIAEVLQHWLAGDDYQHRAGGFMGKSWDTFVPGPAVWKEVRRCCALRARGPLTWQWVYGSGPSKEEGFSGVGIEMEPEYVEIARCRIEAIAATTRQAALFQEVE